MRSDGIEVGVGLLVPPGGQSRAEVNLLDRVRLVANEQRHPERFAGSDLRLAWIEIGQMFDVVGPPECLVKSPRAAEYQAETRRRRFKAAGADVADGLRLNALKDVAGYASADQRLPEDKPHRLLGEFFQLSIGKIILRLVRTPRLSRHLRVRHFAIGRNVLSWIFRTLALGKVQVGGVRKIVDLLRLPGTKPLAVVVDVESIARSFHLGRKSQGIRRQVKGIGGENAGSLMVLVIFAYVVIGQPGEDHLRAGEAHQADDFLLGLAMSPALERTEHIGSGRVGSIEKPGIDNAVGGERVSRFHFANISQSL